MIDDTNICSKMLGNAGEISGQETSAERAPPKNPGEVASAAEASIDALPDAVLQYCFSFIGKGHYRYISGTSRHFDEIYSLKHEKKTARKLVAFSVSSAELCLQDAREEAVESTSDTLRIIFVHAAMVGNVTVLKWAHDKGHEPEAIDFLHSFIHGHVAVLQWAEENGLDWFSNDSINAAARYGHVNIFEWIHSTGRSNPWAGDASLEAALSGQCAVLNWLKEHKWLGSIPLLWQCACYHDGLDVLDWLFENAYSVDRGVIGQGVNLDRRNVLLWAREHGLAWDAETCVSAVHHENLPLLQWLRENDCPWDSTVIIDARDIMGREDIAQWAIDNGCPTE